MGRSLLFYVIAVSVFVTGAYFLLASGRHLQPVGILPPKIFGVMVLMALTTTFMAGPLLSLAEFWRYKL
jgi:hypothetical protein